MPVGCSNQGVIRVLSLTDSLIKYLPCLHMQERLVAERKAGSTPDTILIVQVGEGEVCSRDNESRMVLGVIVSPQRVPLLLNLLLLLPLLFGYCCSISQFSPLASAALTQIF